MLRFKLVRLPNEKYIFRNLQLYIYIYRKALKGNFWLIDNPFGTCLEKKQLSYNFEKVT
jgi:hypothetical protein